MRVEFGGYILDSETRLLLRHTDQMALSTKAFDVLQLLVERRPNVVSKAELHDRIWPRTFVVDANLNVLVAEIRAALNDDAHTPTFIRTVHKVGYAFCGPTLDLSSSPRDPLSPSRCWLAWNAQRFTLAEGENIVGRDPRCAVWVDASGVSRRHARIHVAGDRAVLEDLGSRNGTFVRDSRVASTTPLEDGDVVRLGSTTMTFRIWSEERAPQTERLTAR